MKNKYDLSILIPARHEEFLQKTIEDILANIEGKTEVIAVLDGEWPLEPMPQYDNVRLVYLPESIGQRAATNLACKLSDAKYVMKVDAHCCFDKGFDVKMMADIQDDWTMIPLMKNLHAFNWVCENDHIKYQGPTPEKCEVCNSTNIKKEIVFKPRERTPNSTSYRFDKTMHFQYWQEYKKKQTGDLVDTLSIQGSCFMMTKDKYLELNICDEALGSWGQQGVEVAMKTWLSGGRVVCNKKTWYAHMFRTQGGDFGFPYKQRPESEIKAVREKTRELFVNGKWPLAKKSFKWLLEKFGPVPDWDIEAVNEVKAEEKEIPNDGPTKGIIFYTDNQLNLKIARKVQQRLRDISKEKNIPIVSVSLKPMDNMGKNIHIPLPRGKFAYFTQILTALESSSADIIYFTEHDVFYDPSHFDFTPQDKNKFYYNSYWWKIWPDGFAARWSANQVSGLCAYKTLLLEYYRNRLKEIEEKGFDRSYEPGSKIKGSCVAWKSKLPNIDIRHENNLTKSHRSPSDFRDKSTCVDWEEGTIDDVTILKEFKNIFK